MSISELLQLSLPLLAAFLNVLDIKSQQFSILHQNLAVNPSIRHTRLLEPINPSHTDSCSQNTQSQQ